MPFHLEKKLRESGLFVRRMKHRKLANLLTQQNVKLILSLFDDQNTRLSRLTSVKRHRFNQTLRHKIV